jgi:MGT family glycosyltransferase
VLGAFGDPGHAFPAIALGAELVRRGHDVHLQTWRRWAEEVRAEGMSFHAAPEYDVFPTLGRTLRPYEAVERATRATVPLVEELAPDAVVADILTLAPALAAERCGVPAATLIPHVHPDTPRSFPIYSLGARLPRTAAGRGMWSVLSRLVDPALARGREELNEVRRRLGLPPRERVHGGISDRLVLVATFPQLEYPRSWPAHVHVTGPLLWEPPYHDVAPPAGEDPLVLVAPSTSQDPSQRLLAAALEGLAGERVRVLATENRRPAPGPLAVPPNARLVDWVSYARTMPRCAVVVCHGGHGTVARALASGCAVLACPAAGDMYENAARVDWAGAGVRLPHRFVTPAAVRLALRRLLAEPERRERARELAAWARANDGARRAAELVEALVVPAPAPALGVGLEPTT